eukprot:16082140-Heterocapsa_arctica.AAC.1
MEPMPTKLYEGMRIVLTKNQNKKEDFVNGMVATVNSYDEATGSLLVTTRTGKLLVISKRHERVENSHI